MQTNTVIELQKGQNTISVKGLTDCQGSFEKNIFLGNNINIYPNPVDDVLQINLGTSSSQTTVEIYSLLGKRLYTQTTALNRLIIDTSNFAKGTYILNVNSATDHQNLKIIKQ
jgi:hypothetical protein